MSIFPSFHFLFLQPQNLLNVLGDFNQTGGDSFYNSIYGEVWAHDSGVVALTEDVYSNFTNLTMGNINGFQFNVSGNNELVSNHSGMLSINSQFSFNGAANTEYHLALAIGGQRILQCHTERKIGTGNDVGSASITCLCPITAGDAITAMVENTDSDADVTIHDINLNIVRIGN